MPRLASQIRIFSGKFFFPFQIKLVDSDAMRNSKLASNTKQKNLNVLCQKNQREKKSTILLLGCKIQKVKEINNKK